MAITVGDIYTAFPAFNPEDIIALMGADNLTAEKHE